MLWRWLAMTGKARVAVALASPRSAGRARGRPQRARRRARRAVDRRVRYWLARRRGPRRVAFAFVLAVMTRSCCRCVAAAAVTGGASVSATRSPGQLLVALAVSAPSCSVARCRWRRAEDVVADVRFNGPLFEMMTAVATPRLADSRPSGVGLLTAAWARSHLDASDPARRHGPWRSRSPAPQSSLPGPLVPPSSQHPPRCQSRH